MELKERIKRDLPMYSLSNLHVLTSYKTITRILMLVQSRHRPSPSPQRPLLLPLDSYTLFLSAPPSFLPPVNH